MADAETLYEVCRELGRQAATIRDVEVAAGRPPSTTIEHLVAGDPAAALIRWGEEMYELTGVLNGTHDHPYIMEAAQVWHWACLHAVLHGAAWSELDVTACLLRAPTLRLDDTNRLLDVVDRLVALGAEAPPAKPFLLWFVAGYLYRQQTPHDRQWSQEQILEVDRQEMIKQAYMRPILAEYGL